MSGSSKVLRLQYTLVSMRVPLQKAFVSPPDLSKKFNSSCCVLNIACVSQSSVGMDLLHRCLAVEISGITDFCQARKTLPILTKSVMCKVKGAARQPSAHHNGTGPGGIRFHQRCI